MPSKLHSRFAFLFIGFGLCFVSGTPAELSVFHQLRPIVKADGYRHDRFGTLPRDHFKEFRAYVT